MADLTDLDSPLAGGTADAAVSNTAPSGGEGSTPSSGTIGHKVLSARLRSHAVEDIPADVQAVIAGSMERAFREKVLPAVDPDRHFHIADLSGDAFYVDGVRMKHATCRTCGVDLEDRRA